MLQDRDFSRMNQAPVSNATELKAFYKNFPLFMVPDIWEVYDKEPKKIINFILLMYDPESPFVKRYQNVKKRIIAVSDYTGVDKLDKFEEIVGYQTPLMLQFIDMYVKHINSRLWSMIVVADTTFFEYQTQLLTVVGGKDSKDRLTALNLKTKILQAIDDLGARLDGYYSKLYASDAGLEDIIKTKGISPEGIARGESYA